MSERWSDRMSLRLREWSALRERILREHRLKAGPGFGSMVPERQSRMVKIV
jgi:hypothetical protein